jgi:hypothetical protein
LKVDFVVVACSRDFELLKLQARSIARFLDPELVNQIWIILNDSDPTFVNQVYNIRHEYGLLHDRVAMIDYTNVVTLADLDSNFEYYNHRDWVSAQVARLLISRMIASDWYVNLDCKNILINLTSKNTFFHNGLAKEIGRIPKNTKIKTQSDSWWSNSCKYFGFDGESISPQHCYSPFVFSTSQVQNLINYGSNEKKLPLGHTLFDSYCHPQIDSTQLADISLYCAWLWFNDIYTDYYCNTNIFQISLINYKQQVGIASLGEIHIGRNRHAMLYDQEKQTAVKDCLVTQTKLLTDLEWDNFLLSFDLNKQIND